MRGLHAAIISRPHRVGRLTLYSNESRDDELSIKHRVDGVIQWGRGVMCDRVKFARFLACSIYTNNMTKVTLLKGYISCIC